MIEEMQRARCRVGVLKLQAISGCSLAQEFSESCLLGTFQRNASDGSWYLDLFLSCSTGIGTESFKFLTLFDLSYEQGQDSEYISWNMTCMLCNLSLRKQKGLESQKSLCLSLCVSLSLCLSLSLSVSLSRAHTHTLLLLSSLLSSIILHDIRQRDTETGLVAQAGDSSLPASASCTLS